ncbi:MAG: VWA domain-containing protein [Thermoanaerobaculia bacterium]
MRFLPAATLLLAFPLLARQEPVPDQPFAESIDVSVANVEVYVTDRSGQPARGLSRDDFQLFIDGKPVTIVNFAEVAEGSRVAEPELAVATEPAPEPVQAAPAPPPADALSLVVYVDNDNLRPFGRNRVLRQLQGFLDSMVGPRDRVMVVTHEQGVNVRRPLSAGRESLAADLKKLERLATRGVQQDSQLRSTLQLVRDLGCERLDEAQQVARGYAQGVSADARTTLNSLASVVESLSGIEGRKAVLYVSDGIAMHPGEEVFGVMAEMCGDNPSFKTEDLLTPFRKLTRLANANGVTFYTLESAGVRNLSSVSAEDPRPMLSTNLDLGKTADVQDSLFNLASETGGRAILNANDIKPELARVAGDLRSYYSLGYSPERSGDGRVHAIEVKVKREGLRVRNRTTYTNRPREERLAARVQTALLHGIVDNPLEAGLELVSSEPAGRGQHLVTLRVKLPLKQLVLLSQGDVWTGQLTLWIGARDAAGRVAPVQSVHVPVRIPAPPGKDQLAVSHFAYDMRMRMAERGDQTVAVGIQDDLGHTTSFITGAFRVDRKGVTVASSPGPSSPGH